jgi:DNA-binding Xre family transcriptional regulator
MSILDSLNILLKADTKGLQAGLKAGASSIKSFAGSAIGGFAGVATAIGTYVAAIGSSAVVSTLKDMTMAAIDNAGKLDDLAQNLGISVQALQSLTYAAKLSGVELSGLEGLLKKLAVNLAEAGTGKGKQFEALQQLGLDAQTLINMPLDEAMKKIASELAKIENTSLRAGLGMDLFGKAMIDANAFIGRGTAGIEELEKHYASLGAQLTDEQVSKLTAAGDALDDLGIIAEGVGSQVGSILAPIITDITNQFVTMGVKSGALKETIKTVAEVAVMLAARVMDVAQGIVWYVNAHRVFIQGYAHIFIETAYQVVNALDMISGSTMAASSGLKDLRNANLKNIKDLAVSTTTGWGKNTWGQDLEAYTKHAQAKGDVDAKAATQKRQIDEFLRKKAMEDAAYNEANAAHEKKWQDEQAAAIKAKVDAAEKLSNATKDLTASLEMQARTWGMNSTQAKIYELQMKGVTAAELQKQNRQPLG